jgi:hypothetical protein
MSAPLIVLMKHADVLNFGFFPEKLEEFFTAEFLSLIGDKEKTERQAWMGVMLKGGLSSAMQTQDWMIINDCATNAKIDVLGWGFEQVGWITRTKKEFEWTAGHSMETSAAAVIAAKVAASAPPARLTKLQRVKAVGVKRLLGAKKTIVESRAVKFTSAGVTKAVELVSKIKDFSELAEFSVAAGNSVIQIRSGNYSGAGSSLLTAFGILSRRNAPRPNLNIALHTRSDNE